MKKGSAIILASSFVIAAALGTIMTRSDISASRTDFDACQKRHAVWLANKATVEAKDRAFQAEEAARKERGEPPVIFGPALETGLEPVCIPPTDDSGHVVLNAFIATAIFVMLFVVGHGCWLVARLYRKVMDKLS